MNYPVFLEDIEKFLLVALGAGFLVFIPTCFLFRGTTQAESWYIRAQALTLILGAAFLGAAAGYAGGLSRVGVVGDIIPAALALAGGVSAYLFGVDRSQGVIASVVAAAFGVSLVVSFSAGAERRSHFDLFDHVRTSCYSSLSDGDLLGNREAFCRYSKVMGITCLKALFDQEERIFEESDNDKELRWAQMRSDWSQFTQNSCK